jgi:hypothetical protein
LRKEGSKQERSRNRGWRKVLKREKRKTFENREGRRDLRNNWRREPLPFSITTVTSTASHHPPPPAAIPVKKKKPSPLHRQEEQQQHRQRHCQVLEVKTKKERKEKEPPSAVRIATTSATPEPLPSSPSLLTAPAP